MVGDSDGRPLASCLAGRDDLATRHDDGSSPAQEFDEHTDAPRIIERNQFPQSITERTGLDPHRLADAQRCLMAQAAPLVGFALPGFDHSSRQRHGAFISAGRHQLLYANGAVDAAPLVAIEIKRDEEVAGKKRHAPDLDPVCVTPRLLPQGKERPESLVAQLGRRTVFAVALAPDGEPSLAGQQLSAVVGGGARF